ncbi:cation/multidrug efflux pump [Xenococcus sp. PCC 7305]|nr:efflux RND transporter permease subunit [Xenococcus sp. PCC 7305]ELS04530.1 cation/multidrug efflux pump [Xenococcus sp. PCC 7305]
MRSQSEFSIINQICRALQRRVDCMEDDAILCYAVSDRLRPIFMSAGTSVLGMLPLAILPGKGAELYQGLGIALTGGLALSTLLTPTVIPALIGLLKDFQPRKSIKEQELQHPESRERSSV